MTANGEVQTREEATVYVKQWDFFVTDSRSVFIGETLRRTWAHVSLENAVKIHISSKMARELTVKNQTMFHLWSLVYLRVPP